MFRHYDLDVFAQSCIVKKLLPDKKIRYKTEFETTQSVVSRLSRTFKNWYTAGISEQVVFEIRQPKKCYIVLFQNKNFRSVLNFI